jgi:Flp pilus assembly protein TadD
MFEEANNLAKSDIEIVNNLGFSYLNQGNLASAQQTITLALTLSPDRATAWENLGEVFGIKGEVNKAVACFSNAYRFSKDRLKMHRYMKKLNEKEGVKNLQRARAKAINWAEKSYLNILKNTD